MAYLPLAALEASCASPLPEDLGPASPLRILVVAGRDDAVDLSLRALGHHVEHAGEPEPGLRIAEAMQPHIVLIDLDLPGMDGPSLLRALRVLSPRADLWPIGVTRRSWDDPRVYDAAEVFPCVVSWPVDAEALAPLLAHVSRRLRQRSPSREAPRTFSSPRRSMSEEESRPAAGRGRAARPPRPRSPCRSRT